jgi:hypothetical protein
MKLRQASLRMTPFLGWVRKEQATAKTETTAGSFGFAQDDTVFGWVRKEQATATAKTETTAGSFGYAQDRLFDCASRDEAARGFAQDAFLVRLREASLRMTISISLNHLSSTYMSLTNHEYVDTPSWRVSLRACGRCRIFRLCGTGVHAKDGPSDERLHSVFWGAVLLR